MDLIRRIFKNRLQGDINNIKKERNVSKDFYYVVNYQVFLLPETRTLLLIATSLARTLTQDNAGKNHRLYDERRIKT